MWKKLRKLLGMRHYFPSGEYGDFPDLQPNQVAKMIRDFCNEREEDFSKLAIYEFMENHPDIDWMAEVANELSEIDLKLVPGKPGTGLLTEEGCKRAIKIAEKLEADSNPNVRPD